MTGDELTETEMAEESELSRRLNQAMSGTIHEQLRTLVHDARAGIEQVSGTAERQEELIAEARRLIAESEQRVDGTVAELGRRLEVLSAGVNESLEIVRAEIESFAVQSERKTSEALAEMRLEMDEKLSGIGEQLKTEAALGSEIAARTEALAATLASVDEAGERAAERQSSLETRVESLERALEHLQTRVEQSIAASTKQWQRVLAKLEDTSGIEERAAQRLVELLGRMFAAAEQRKEELTVVTDEMRANFTA